MTTTIKSPPITFATSFDALREAASKLLTPPLAYGFARVEDSPVWHDGSMMTRVSGVFPVAIIARDAEPIPSVIALPIDLDGRPTPLSIVTRWTITELTEFSDATSRFRPE